MNWLVILLLIVWVYVLYTMKRADMGVWYFLFGSVGFFVFAMILVEPVVVAPLQKAVSAVSGMLGELTGVYDSYFQQGILFVQNGGESLSLYIDFECSGVIELLAFFALLWFFPVYALHEKLVVSVIGTFVIYIANVFRIFFICVLIYLFGNDIYFFAHTIFARIFFYACSVLLYFYVFTKPQIVRQKVGAFHYDRV
jgi:exosortase family protein XrtG